MTTLRRGCAMVIVAAGWVTTLTAGEPLYPNPDWPTGTDVTTVHASSDRLRAYEDWLRERCGDSWAAVVVKGGYLVYQGRGPRCHVRQKNDCGSILKPLQATVLGVALAQGRLKRLDENALPYWKNAWRTPFENDHVISFRQFAQYHDRWNEAAPPGTFHYNNAGATAAGACIAGLFRDVRGSRPMGIAEVARDEVMRPIGSDWDLWYWEQDFTSATGNPGPRMVLEASVYELAKLGYLWLRRGRWQDRQLFSDDFYRDAVTNWSPDTGSQEFGYFGHYGYWWFVNSTPTPTKPGEGMAPYRLLPHVPEDAFYAIGNGHPKRATCLLVIPSHDTIAVLSMERLSDDGRWDVIRNSRVPVNDGPREWSAQVARLHFKP